MEWKKTNYILLILTILQLKESQTCEDDSKQEAHYTDVGYCNKQSRNVKIHSDDWLKDLLSRKLNPLVNSQGTVAPRVVLLQDGLILVLSQIINTTYYNQVSYLSWSYQPVFLGSLDQLRHHRREVGEADLAALGGVVVSEQLQHEPVQLNILGPSRVAHGLLDKGLVLVNIAMINDGLK